MQLKPKRDKRKGRRGWRIRGTLEVWRDGQRYTAAIDQTLPDATYAEACAVARQKEAAARQRTLENRDAPLLFGEVLEAYREANPGIRFLEKPMVRLGAVEFDKVTDAMIIEESRYAYPDASEATRRRQFYVPCRAVINFHFKGPKPPQDKNTRTYIIRPSKAEILIRYFSTHKYGDDPFGAALLTTLYGVGGRVGETLAVDGLNDIEMDLNQITFRETKSGAQRVAYMPPRVKAAISRLPTLGEPGPLFRRYDGKPFTEKVNRGGQIKNRFRKAVELAGLDTTKITPHVLRHSWATCFHSQVRDETLLKRCGGWASDVHERYVHIASDELAKEAFKHGWDYTGAKSGTWQGEEISAVAKSQ